MTLLKSILPDACFKVKESSSQVAQAAAGAIERTLWLLRRRSDSRRRRYQRGPTELLEDRLLLASVMDSGQTLQIELDAGERVFIEAKNGRYDLRSDSSVFNNDGVTDTADFFGLGTQILSLLDLPAYSTIEVTDGGGGSSFLFEDSGSNPFVHDFSVTLNNGARDQSVVFRGDAHFGNNDLTVETDRGIQLFTGAELTTVNGNISLTAVNDGPVTGAVRGIALVEAIITTSGSGNISLDGTATDAGPATDFRIGISLQDSSRIQSTSFQSDAGSITINGTGGTGEGNNYGVLLATTSRISSVNGDISVTGHGGSGTGEQNRGVTVIQQSVVESVGNGIDAGTITIAGTGGAGTSSNYGVHLDGAARVSSGMADIQVTGQGGNGTGHANRGIHVSGQSAVVSFGSGTNAGSITLNGIGGQGTSSNTGVNLGGGTVTYVDSVSGNVSITGQGGSGSGNNNHGVALDQGRISSSGADEFAATITIDGTGGTGPAGNVGVLLTTANSSVRSTAGDIRIDGTGGSGSGNNHDGVQIILASVESTGAGAGAADIIINGVGGNAHSDNEGIELSGEVISNAGAIQLTGTGGGQNTGTGFRWRGRLESETGDISVTAAGAGTASHGVRIDGNVGSLVDVLSVGTGQTTVTATGSGAFHDLRLSETISIENSQPTGTLSFVVNSIDAAGTTNLSANRSPEVTARTATEVEVFTREPAMVGGIDFQQDVRLEMSSVYTVRVGDVHSADGGKITSTGQFDIGSNVELRMKWNPVWQPVANAQITLIERNGGSGAFTGLAEGAVLPEFFNATISYVGGDGDDVVLTLPSMVTPPALVELGELGFGGVTFYGEEDGDRAGQSVNSVGDVNGDGFDDFVIGANSGDSVNDDREDSGEAFLVYGGPLLPPSINAASLDGHGVVFFGADVFDTTGHHVDGADVNGDGFSDILISAHTSDSAGNQVAQAGGGYIVWGGRSLPPVIDLASLGNAGVTIHGPDVSDLTGNPISAVGDVNDDGFEDVGLGGIWADSVNNARANAGEVHIILGGSSLPSVIDLATATTGVVRIFGAQAGDEAGVSVSPLGDINGDDVDDFVIGARYADSQADNRFRAGEAYVIYGDALIPSSIDLEDPGAADVTIFGIDAYDFGGWRVGGTGDVNGDGYNDILYGASGGDSKGNARLNAGETYLIFGGPMLPATVNLDSLGSAGVTIYGADVRDNAGRSVDIVGDVNGDGFDDIAIGARNADGDDGTAFQSGEVYLIAGRGTFPSELDLRTPGTADVILFGKDSGDEAGLVVRGAGDINNDGLDDVIIGAPGADHSPGFLVDRGEAFLVYGSTLLTPVAPAVIRPATTINEARPTLEWHASVDAESYEVWLELIGGDNNPVVNPTVTETSYRLMTSLTIGRYRTWVRANQTDGPKSRWMTQTFAVTDRTTIHPPAFHSPVLRPAIEWTPVPGAVAYRVFVTNITQQVVAVDEVVTSTSLTPAADLQFGRHRIWVQPIGPGNYSGEWSASRDFQIGPELLAPVTPTLDTTPEFQWTRPDGAETFDLYLLHRGSAPQIFTSLSDTSFTPEQPLPSGDFRWWIRGTAANGRSGAWSPVAEFNIGGRTDILAPSGTVNDGRPVIEWKAVAGAGSYEIYLYHDETGQIIVRQTGISLPRFESPPLAEGSYRVWIRTWTPEGAPASWSRAHRFTHQSLAPGLTSTPVAPLTPTFETNPTFEWDAHPDAVTFNIFLTNGTEVVSQTGIPAAEWTPVSPLTAGPWQWQVQAVNSSGVEGPWSDIALTDTSARVVLIAPTGITSNRQPTIIWSAVIGADRYVLQLDNLTSGLTQIREDRLTDTQYVPLAPLAPGLYRAWVRAVGVNNNQGPWSLRLDFEVV